MIIFYLVNSIFIILLFTKCCFTNTDKYEKIIKNIEHFLGIPDRSFKVSNLNQLNEEEMEKLMKETPNLLDDNSCSDDEKNAVIEKSKEVINTIQSEFEKKDK